jgi:hypothetical protein
MCGSFGHEDAFPPHRPNAGYVIGRRPSPGRAGMGEIAERGRWSPAAVRRSGLICAIETAQ